MSERSYTDAELEDGDTEFDPSDTYFAVFRQDRCIFAVVVPRPYWDRFKRCSDQHTPLGDWPYWANAAEGLLEWLGYDSAPLKQAHDDLIGHGLTYLPDLVILGNPEDEQEFYQP